ncbi:hypothetical protein ACFVAD_13155 [Sutcliffiella sp. NPDC057660]|uniref:hypothetical protein n=1 Tax=Sutcliffiella sp. NPDC057660 TaxID=3346199 RepID=UPI0036BD564C
MLTYLVGLLVFLIFFAILFKFSFGFSLRGRITIASIILVVSAASFSVQEIFTPWHSLLLIILLLLLATIFLQNRSFLYQDTTTEKNNAPYLENSEVPMKDSSDQMPVTRVSRKKLEKLSDDLTLK